ncbi:MAG: TonB-dependent receptor [Prevotella sp.]|nr:TonB-dependent receptor [Bacteroides sp.]MCM1365994.1 TonB-dependent receptor [Prevotella sp.]MCM1437343.1 TonB-dependent receptor [Prevotella sp.]
MTAKPFTVLTSTIIAMASVLPPSGNAEAIDELDEIVVTATRTPKSLKDVPVVTRIITKEELKKSDATNIQDLLTEELPGLEFGLAMTQETSLNLNGFGGNAILFLIDGERMAGETLDNIDYARLNLENVERIEIVKGASSALYGANAVGGVVNIITSENNKPWHINLNTRYRGAGNEWRYGGEASFNQGKWNSNTSIQYTSMDRIRLADIFDEQSRVHEIFGGNTFNLKEKLTFRLNNNVRLTARGGYFTRVSKRTTYDDHYKDYSIGLKSIIDFSPSQNLEIGYGYDQYDKSRYMGGVRTHEHDYSNRQNTVHALFTQSFSINALTVGADYMNDYLTSYQFLDHKKHEQNSVDVFAQFDYNPISWLNLVGSLRYDYYSASSHGAMTARLASLFKLKWLSIRASYSGGFRAPSLKELYMDFDMAGIQWIYGNPNLKPEKSHNFNLSLERNGSVTHGLFAGSYSFSAMGYLNLYVRRITTMDHIGINGDGFQYSNEDDVKTSGIDLTFRYRANNGFGLSASYNYLNTMGNKLDSQFSQPRPHSATWRIDYDHRFSKKYQLYAGLSGRYLSKADTEYPTDGAYSLWKLTIRQTLSKGIDITFAIDNLFNYKPKIYYYNSPLTKGITWQIGLSLDLNSIIK